MSNEHDVSDHDLHAFIDGELAPDRAAEVAKLVAAAPTLAEAFKAFSQDKQGLAKLHLEELDRPLPAKLLGLIDRHAQTTRSAAFNIDRRKWNALALAAAFVLMFGLGLTVQKLFAPGEDPILGEAFAARAETMRPEAVYSADSVAAVGEADRILAAALEMPVSVPDLTKLGYQLEAIRVYSGVSGGKSVSISYRDEAMRVFTLYLRHPSGPPRVDLLQRNGTRICIWQDDVLGSVMLGDMSAAAMARVASLAYSGLTS